MLRKRFLSVNERNGSECVLVAKAVASSVETLLGSGKSLKCCHSPGSAILSSSTPKILETIDIEHPAGFIINSTCQSFYKEFGCGCTTLVCLVGYWAAAFQDLVDVGIPTTVIVRTLDEISEEMVNVLKRSSISLRTLQDDRRFQDKNSDFIKDDRLDPVSSVDILPANPNGKCHKTQCLSTKLGNTTKSKLGVSKLTTESQLMSSSSDCGFSRCEEDNEVAMNDEFDSCFDGLEESARNFERPLSLSSNSFSALKLHSSSSNNDTVATFVETKPNSLAGESVRNSKSRKDSRGFCVKLSCVSDKHDVVGKLLDKHCNVTDRKNNSELLDISGKFPILGYIGKGIDKRIFKKPNVQNVILRSRHLTDITASKSSHVQHFNAVGSHVNTALGDFNVDVDHGISTQSSEHKIKHDSPNLQQASCEFQSISQKDAYWLDFLGHGLAHGKEHEMLLAVEILKKQFISSEKNLNKFSFLLDRIGVQTVLGPPVSNSLILEGAVVELSKENQSIVACDSDTTRRIALVNGDITYDYRHPGFKDPVHVTRTVNKDVFCNSVSNAQTTWMDKVMLVAKSLNLGVVGTRGKMTNVLRDRLQALGVVVLEHLSNRQFDILSKMTGTTSVSYILDLTTHQLGKPVVIRIWNSGWTSTRYLAKSSLGKTSVFGQIFLWSDEEVRKSDCVVHSVLLCGPVQDLVDDSELKFWNCVHRLRNAFEDRCVLAGGGEIERLCIKHLENIKVSRPNQNPSSFSWIQEDFEEFRSLIIEAVCSGLSHFTARTTFNNEAVGVEQIPANVSDVENPEFIFDNYLCKVEGWRRAIRIVKLFLNSEYHIITGL